MADENVDNYFEQPAGGGRDNKLILGGSANSAAGVSVKNPRVTVQMDDISTAQSVWVSIGEACTFKKLTSIINGAITVDDAEITTEIDGVAVTGGDLTIANSGSAAGVVDTTTPTAANVLTASQGLEIITDGGSTGTVAAVFTVEFELS